jgi:antitoxin component YwqK of YwqJK toxin-antitoxin module
MHEVHFKNGERDGAARYWHEDGTLLMQERYEQGRRM